MNSSDAGHQLITLYMPWRHGRKCTTNSLLYGTVLIVNWMSGT